MHRLIYIYSGKLCLYGLLRSRGGECERGEVEQYCGFAPLTGPLPFESPFAKMESRIAPQKTL